MQLGRWSDRQWRSRNHLQQMFWAWHKALSLPLRELISVLWPQTVSQVSMLPDRVPQLAAQKLGDGSKPWFFAGLSFRHGGSDQFLFLEGGAWVWHPSLVHRLHFSWDCELILPVIPWCLWSPSVTRLCYTLVQGLVWSLVLSLACSWVSLIEGRIKFPFLP